MFDIIRNKIGLNMPYENHIKFIITKAEESLLFMEKCLTNSGIKIIDEVETAIMSTMKDMMMNPKLEKFMKE